MLLQLAFFVTSLVISHALQPKPARQKPASFDEFDFPTAEDGTPQIVVFGDVWLTDWTVIGVGNYRSEPIIIKQKSLFGSKKSEAGFRYYMSVHMGLCRALDDIVEIKVADRTIFSGNISNDNISTLSISKPNLFGGDKGEGGISGKLTIARGAIDQLPNAELSKMHGKVIAKGYYTEIPIFDGFGMNGVHKVWTPAVIEPVQVPAYRGVVTILFDGQICSNSPYPKPWSFRVRRTQSGWDGEIWYPEKSTIWLKNNQIKAMNPAHILYEVQTNRSWGRGFSTSQLDIASFKAVADQLYSENFGLCLAWRRQESINEFVQQIIDQIGAALFIDRTTGLWKIVLIRDNYNPEVLESYDYNNGLLRIEDDSNSSNDTVTNVTFVNYKDPLTNEDSTVRAENLAAIQQYGVIQANHTYVGIPTAELAGRLAARDMKISQSALKKFKLIFDRSAYQIQPASVFKISLADRGINSLIVRAARVVHDTLTNGEITIEVVQDVFGLPDSNYINEQPKLWSPPNFQAEAIIYQEAYELPFAELLTEFNYQYLQSIHDHGYVGFIAEQPGVLQKGFNILGKTSTSLSYESLGSGDFGFISGLKAPIEPTLAAITIVLKNAISSNVEVGARAFIDNEIVRIESLDRVLNTVTLSRGCIDTVPTYHAETAMFRIYSNLSSVADRLLTSHNSYNFKLPTYTAQDELDEELSTVLNFSLTNRLQRPYPPGLLKLNNLAYPSIVTGDLTISWGHRNRLLQLNGIPTFNDVTDVPESGSTYNLKIYDGNNSILLEKTALTSTSLTWIPPKFFDGDIETVFQLTMTGSEGSLVFNDTSPNQLTVLNKFNTVIQSDADATENKCAYFGRAYLNSHEHVKLDIYSEDHCIEFRVKTLTNRENLDTLYFSIQHDRSLNENIGVDYGISVTPLDDALRITVRGLRYSPTGSYNDVEISYLATGLSANNYYDVAIECTSIEMEAIAGSQMNKALITIYVDGNAKQTGIINTLSYGYPCHFYSNLSPNTSKGSQILLNGLRITKLSGGRYGNNYTPAPYQIQSADQYWSNVVLLIDASNSNTLDDLSNNPVSISASPMITIVSDSLAHGSYVIGFNRASLETEQSTLLNLRDKSYVIDGRAKLNPGLVFDLSGSMRLILDQNSLSLINYEPHPTVLTVLLESGLTPDWSSDRYFNFKIIRDAKSGVVILSFNDKSASGLFNSTLAQTSSLLIAPSTSSLVDEVVFDYIKIETTGTDSNLVPNVVNPLRIELASERDGIRSYQTVIAETELVG